MSSHPPRLRNFAYIGRYRYFLTFSTYQRRAVFIDAATFDLLRAQFLRSSTEYCIAVDAYCAMPDHVHALAYGVSACADLRAFMRDLKQRAAWEYRQRTGLRLWQGSYYDHVLRDDEGIDGVIKYILDNPVRGRLVEKPEDYPFWDSLTQTREGLLAFVRGAGDWKPSPRVDVWVKP